MSAPDSVTGSGPLAETLSPELVLVDPGLAAYAREQLDDPHGTPARLRDPGVLPNGRSGSSFDDDITTAVRRLAESALAGEAPEAAARRPRRLRRRVAVTAAVCAAFALALLVADLRLDPGEAPATAETTTLG